MSASGVDGVVWPEATVPHASAPSTTAPQNEQQPGARRRPRAYDILRYGLRQAKVDLRTRTLSWDGITYLIPAAVVLISGRNGSQMQDTGDLSISVVQWLLPGMLALAALSIGFSYMSIDVQAEKDDGTLMRMRAVPHGVSGYLCGKVLYQCACVIGMFVLTLAAGAAVVGDMMPSTPARWLAVFCWALLGVVWSIVAGVVIGCLGRTSMLPVLAALVFGALVFFSGIVTPITGMSGWVQVFALIFPLYWIGLGMRSAFLPDHAVVLELDESWRTLESLAVVGVWVVLLVLVAPALIRRMVRGVSGSSVAAARQRILAKGY